MDEVLIPVFRVSNEKVHIRANVIFYMDPAHLTGDFCMLHF